MSPHARYQSHAVSGWTRIDMLLSIYQTLNRQLEAGIADSERTGLSPPPSELLRVQQLLLLLLDGLDDSAADTAPPIRSLLLFALTQAQSQTMLGWRSAQRVLATLEDAFQSIAEEARQLEQSGAIPPLNLMPQRFDVAIA